MLCDRGGCLIAGTLTSNTNLRQLDMSKNCVGDATLFEIAKALRVNTSLQTLFLQDNPFQWTCLNAMGSALGVNSTLKHLDVNTILPQPSDALALTSGLRENKGLEMLDLSLNTLSDTGVVNFASVLQANRSLNFLHIRGDPSLHALRALKDAVFQNPCIENFKVKHAEDTYHDFSTMQLELLRDVQRLCVRNRKIYRSPWSHFKSVNPPWYTIERARMASLVLRRKNMPKEIIDLIFTFVENKQRVPPELKYVQFI